MPLDNLAGLSAATVRQSPSAFSVHVAASRSEVNPAARKSAVSTLCCLNAAPRNAGQQYSSYDRSRISASVRGTLMPNSCGGAYWHA